MGAPLRFRVHLTGFVDIRDREPSPSPAPTFYP
jgi:hypothetical protein